VSRSREKAFWRGDLKEQCGAGRCKGSISGEELERVGRPEACWGEERETMHIIGYDVQRYGC